MIWNTIRWYGLDIIMGVLWLLLFLDEGLIKSGFAMLFLSLLVVDLFSAEEKLQYRKELRHNGSTTETEW